MISIFTAQPECKWCGNPHDPGELCQAMRVSRRTFCFTMAGAIAGMAFAGGGLPTGPLFTEVVPPFDWLNLGNAVLRGKLYGLTPEIVQIGRKNGVDLIQPPAWGAGGAVETWSGRVADEDLGSHYRRHIPRGTFNPKDRLR
jgi:hypothetical protein